MLQKEDIEAVVTAVPLWMHAEVASGCLEAGKHVLCEKMMAWDVEGCQRMLQAAESSRKVLEIGYQRYYNPMYQAAYAGVVQEGLLGEMHHARLTWHRNGNWRRNGAPPSPSYSPAQWGYPTFDHLYNWRLYKRYSRGLLAELASHQVSIANWVFGAPPEAVSGTGGIFRFNDGIREVCDHLYATFEYPGGRTATFSSIESNAYEHYSEVFYGTKGTLILRGEAEAYLFPEGTAEPTKTTIEVTPKGKGPALEASESRTADAAGKPVAGAAAGGDGVDRLYAYRNEVSGFCAAVRTGAPLACGPERAFHSASACLRADEAVWGKTRLTMTASPARVTGGTATTDRPRG
jgi:predicted dehydrogenase